MNHSVKLAVSTIWREDWPIITVKVPVGITQLCETTSLNPEESTQMKRVGRDWC